MGDYGAGAGGPAGHQRPGLAQRHQRQLVAWYMDLAGNRTSGTFTTPDAPGPPLDWTMVGPR